MNPTALPPAPDSSRARRPVIAQDDCTGCGRCVTACPPACLGLVWDFATLLRADACDGCGRCEPACPHGVIHMAGPLLRAGT